MKRVVCRYSCNVAFQLVPFILELSRSKKERSKQTDLIRMCLEDETILVPSIFFVMINAYILYDLY